MNVFTPVLLGGLIYTLFRSDKLWVFDWYASYGMLEQIRMLREFALPAKPLFTTWFLYSLPDLLWVYAGTSYFVAVWHPERGLNQKFWTLLTLVLAIGAELMQGIYWVEGTFDNVDLLFYALGYLLAQANALFHTRSLEKRVSRQNNDEFKSKKSSVFIRNHNDGIGGFGQH